jgi:hypothetical protein
MLDEKTSAVRTKEPKKKTKVESLRYNGKQLTH